MPTVPITQSPLRYPGGKSKLKSSIENLIKTNDYSGCTYVEPFSGGAAIALHLLFTDTVGNAIINDFDISVYAFWFSVLNKTNELCKMILETEVTIEEWYKQKEIQQNKGLSNDLLLLGFSTFFLNRTNRSGIIKAGVMGGKNQSGKYKIDCRYNKIDSINKITKISKYKDRIKLYNLDAIDLINNVISNLDKNTFIFFDPPYYKKGQSLYVNFYTHDDHVQLSKIISQISRKKWIVSYDNVEEIKLMYLGYNKIEYDLSYTVQEKYKGKEVMFFSNNMIVPKKI